MVNILISGYYGFDNIGDESILRTLVSSLREHIPDCSLTVLSHNPTSTREKYGVEAVDRMSPVAILRAVKKCDMLISGGGSLLQDVTSSKSLHYYLHPSRFPEPLRYGRPQFDREFMIVVAALCALVAGAVLVWFPRIALKDTAIFTLNI